MNGYIATAPTIFRFIHDLQTKVLPDTRVQLTQADNGVPRKCHPRQLKAVEEAKKLEQSYKNGEISAEAVLRLSAGESFNREFSHMLRVAADADEPADPGRPDPVLDFTQDMYEADEEDGEGEQDSADEEEEYELAERRHEWTVIDWPELRPSSEQDAADLAGNRVRPEEDVDRVVTSVCPVCSIHFDFQYVLAHCDHQLCINCFNSVDRCPFCKRNKGTLATAKRVINNPSLVRTDVLGRQENEILSAGDTDNKLCRGLLSLLFLTYVGEPTGTLWVCHESL